MIYPAIKALLSEMIGLEPESIGPNALDRTIGARMELAGVCSEADYLALLKADRRQLEALIESVVVPETWFFRDQEPFAYLREYIAREWGGKRGGQVLRLLSAPCSTGEEPFSIAIALTQMGLGKKDFCIDAVDISARSLETARRGIYGKSSFREKELAYLSTYFEESGQGVRIDKHIMELVNFQQGNLLDVNFSLNRPLYDVIFCRNLLIYMTQDAKKKLLDTLDSLLVEGGWLCTGHTETMLLRSYGYSLIKHPRAFACRKAGTSKPPSIDIQTDSVSGLTGVNRLVHLASIAAPGQLPRRRLSGLPVDNRSALRVHDPANVLDLVRELGNKGAVERAAEVCEEYLQEHKLDSEAHYLMGLLYEAVNKSELAEGCFLKALYLNPDHYPVLVQLYLIYQQRGDYRKAQAFRERASRVRTEQQGHGCGKVDHDG